MHLFKKFLSLQDPFLYWDVSWMLVAIRVPVVYYNAFLYRFFCTYQHQCHCVIQLAKTNQFFLSGRVVLNSLWFWISLVIMASHSLKILWKFNTCTSSEYPILLHISHVISSHVGHHDDIIATRQLQVRGRHFPTHAVPQIECWGNYVSSGHSQHKCWP